MSGGEESQFPEEQIVVETATEEPVPEEPVPEEPVPEEPVPEEPVPEEQQNTVTITPVSIVPNRWDGLRKNDVDPLQHLFEFVDNSIAHRVQDVPLRIDITLYQSAPINATTLTNRIVIKDNSCGMHTDVLARAMIPSGLAGEWGDDIGSEHGFGMKPALASLGQSPRIQTKSVEQDLGYALETQEIIDLVNGNGMALNMEEIEEIPNHGTIIDIRDLIPNRGEKLGKRTSGWNNVTYLRMKLGQRYRNVLPSDYGVFSSSEDSGIFVTEVSSTNTRDEHKVTPIAPVYYKCPITNNFRTHVEDRTISLSSDNPAWEARIRLGTAPRKPEHWDTIELPRASKYNPYKVTYENAGFDIIHRDIVIATGWVPDPSELEGVQKHGSVNNPLRGEIQLVSGFSSTQTKQFVNRDEAWNQLLAGLRELLFAYEPQAPGFEEPVNLYSQLTWKKKERELTETQYVNQFKNMVATKVVSKAREWVELPKIETFDIDQPELRTDFGKPDVVINSGTKNEILVEAKPIPAEGRHLYQLRAYLDARKSRYGIILSPGLSSSGRAALDYLQQLRTPYAPWRMMYKIVHVDTTSVSQYSTEIDEQ